jgi:hypothetical protein
MFKKKDSIDELKIMDFSLATKINIPSYII